MAGSPRCTALAAAMVGFGSTASLVLGAALAASAAALEEISDARDLTFKVGALRQLLARRSCILTSTPAAVLCRSRPTMRWW